MKPTFLIILAAGLSILSMAACAMARRNLKPSGPDWTSSGRLLEITYDRNDLMLKYEQALARVRVSGQGDLYLECAFTNQLPPYPSYAVVTPLTGIKPDWQEEKDTLVLRQGENTWEISRSALELSCFQKDKLTHRFQVFYQADKEKILILGGSNKERVFGLGEKTGKFELTGRKFGLYNSDTYKYTSETDPIYSAIPFYLGLGTDYQYGMLVDNPGRQEYDFKTSGHEITVNDYYTRIHVLGGDTPAILGKYADLTGHAYLPPLYGFGFHQSRYSYTNQAQVMEVVQAFRSHDLPLDVLYLDIGFMSNKMSFTYDPQAYPQPQKMNQQLQTFGVRTVAIVDPGIKADPAYDVCEQGLREQVYVMYKGSPYKGAVWPGMCYFPDFTAAQTASWWGKYYSRLLKLGISGFWNDMNEPSVFSGPNGTLPNRVIQNNQGYPREHKYLHNIYGHTMINATHTEVQKLLKDQRVFLLTRSGYAGLQRYAFIWTGDNTASWEHLGMNLSMTLNLGLSGVPFSGADVGGYTGSPNGELFTRWIQLGVFLPFLRDHTEQGTRMQEPYQFQKELPIIRKYMRLRYRLLPYIYTLARQSHTSGLPMVRPLWLEYGRDFLDIDQEFLLGRDILVAPILQPLKKSDTLTVTLPAGSWKSLRDGKYYQGTMDQVITLEDIPVYLRAGSIIPVYEQDHDSTMNIKSDSVIGLWIQPDEKGQAVGLRYQDDTISLGYQAGNFSLWQYKTSLSGDSLYLEVSLSEGKAQPHPALVLHVPAQVNRVVFKDKEFPVKDDKATIKF